MLPKRRRDFDSSPDDDYERVSMRDVQLLEPTPTVILAPEPPSLSPMAVELAVELEDTVLALTKLPTRPGSTRPSVAWIATILSMSTVMSLTATLALRGGEVPPTPVAAAAGLAAESMPPPALAGLPVAVPVAVEVPVSAEPEPIVIPVSALPPAPVAVAPVATRKRRVPVAAVLAEPLREPAAEPFAETVPSPAASAPAPAPASAPAEEATAEAP